MLNTFKEIIDKKAYRISSKDRAIFEAGSIQSFFGFDDSDMVEFILFDVNNNQLPQGELQQMVRYITLNSDNIRDYFLISEGTIFKALEFPSEYFIDVERLIKEAGYNNGIFKTQITLLNKRVGFEVDHDKLWIKEISPSMLEIKLLPLKTESSKLTDLKERFNIMVSKDGGFRSDVILHTPSILESINPSQVKSYILTEYPEWYGVFIREFSIHDLDILANRIYTKFIEAAKFEFSNRISSISDMNYGKVREEPPSLNLSIAHVEETIKTILTECIDYYLPMQNINTTSEYDMESDIIKVIENGGIQDIVINPVKPVKPDIINTTPIVIQEPKLDNGVDPRTTILTQETMDDGLLINPDRIDGLNDYQII